MKKFLCDLGGVLVWFQPEETARRLAAGGLDEPYRDGAALINAFYGDHTTHDYERGDIPGAAFIRHFTEKLGFRGSSELFADAWRHIVVPNEPMVRWAREIARQTDVYFFSNVGELHMPWYLDRYPELQFARGLALSFELRALKPEPAFFRRGLDRYGLAAEDCVFLDDLPANVEGARHCGIDAVRFESLAASGPEVTRRLGLPPSEARA